MLYDVPSIFSQYLLFWPLILPPTISLTQLLLSFVARNEKSHTSQMTPLIAQLSIVKARAWAREQVFKVSIVGMDRLERAILKQTKGINGVDTYLLVI